MKKIIAIIPLMACFLLTNCNSNPWGTGGLQNVSYALKDNAHLLTNFSFTKDITEDDFFNSSRFLGHPSKEQIINVVRSKFCSNSIENIGQLEFSDIVSNFNDYYCLNRRQYPDGYKSSDYVYRANNTDVIFFDQKNYDDININCTNKKDLLQDYYSIDNICFSSAKKEGNTLVFSFQYDFIVFDYSVTYLKDEAHGHFHLVWDKVI